jgi:hypothetical protein
MPKDRSKVKLSPEAKAAWERIRTKAEQERNDSGRIEQQPKAAGEGNRGG